jgi:two-component sensor histidine kinase
MATSPAPSRFRPYAAWWGGVTLLWTIDGWITATQIHSMRVAGGAAAAWSDALRQAMVSAYLWVPLTMLALWSVARVPIERDRIILPVLVHMAGAAFVALVRALAVLLLNSWVQWYATVPPFGELYLVSLRNNLVIYWLLLGVGHAVYYARTTRLQRAQLAQAQLLVLKSQLQPHFLFNALNTISAHVRSNPAAAERVVERLSRFLRQSLDSADVHEVTLRQELENIEPYLEIEQLRFEERLNIRRDIASDVLDAVVPHLVLQPLVENAVRHGLSKRAAGGTVAICARREQNELLLEIRDDGAGLPAGFTLANDAGLGLSNTRSRLQQLYRQRYHMEVTSNGGGTVVRLRLPLRMINGRRS